MLSVPAFRMYVETTARNVVIRELMHFMCFLTLELTSNTDSCSGGRSFLDGNAKDNIHSTRGRWLELDRVRRNVRTVSFNRGVPGYQ